MFRILNNYWIELQPQLSNYKQYNGSNKEEENFYGGKSVVFAVTEECLKHKTKSANIKVRVFKEISKYFEIDTCYDAGVTYIDIHSLFNGIVKELSERKGMKNYFTHYHEREPISRSMKGAFEIANEKDPEKSAAINAYVRLSYFGKSIITEFDRFPLGQFHVSEEMYEGYPYQCMELSREEVENGFWGGSSIDLALNQRDGICECIEYKQKKCLIEPSDIKIGENSRVVMMGADGSRGFAGFNKKGGVGLGQVDNMSCATLKKLRDEKARGKSGDLDNDDDIDGDFDGRRGQSWRDGDGLRKKRGIKGHGEDGGLERRGADVHKGQQLRQSEKSDLQDVQSGKKRGKTRGKMSLSNGDAGDVQGLRMEKNGKYRGKLGAKSRYRQGHLIDERGKKVANDDAKRRANLKAMAMGIVTIGLDEAKTRRKSSKISGIFKCPVEVQVSRCYCPSYKLVNCYNYQYC